MFTVDLPISIHPSIHPSTSWPLCTQPSTSAGARVGAKGRLLLVLAGAVGPVVVAPSLPQPHRYAGKSCKDVIARMFASVFPFELEGAWMVNISSKLKALCLGASLEHQRWLVWVESLFAVPITPSPLLVYTMQILLASSFYHKRPSTKVCFGKVVSFGFNRVSHRHSCAVSKPSHYSRNWCEGVQRL